MGDFKLGGPGSGGTGFQKEIHDEHLLAFVGIMFEPKKKTQFGEQDAAHIEYLACVDDNNVFEDVVIFGTVLVPMLVEGAANADIVVARLGKGEAKPGQNPPWLLWDPSEEDMERTARWLDAHAYRTPSGVIHIEPSSTPEPF